MTSLLISPAEAATELLRRRAIRASPIEWARHKGFEPAEHHRFILNEIVAFLDSDDEVLLLFAPPGSAKSTYLSHLFAGWYMGRYPSNSILAATHNIEFAERWGRRVRNDMASDGHILGVALAEDNTAAARWALQSGGEYYGVGAGVGISGFRADLGLGDDFFGSREDAFSATVRRKRWDWYLDDFSARLKPGAKRILMNTRWHEEDVGGRVLQQILRGEVKGRVISIPAIAEDNDILGRAPGEYLWANDPAYDYPAFLRSRQRETSPMMWAALYQQRPAPEEGDYFQRGWFKRYGPDDLPKALNVFGTSDYGTKEGSGDFTVHRVWGIDHEGHIWMLGGWRGQSTTDVWIDRQLDLIAKYKVSAWFGESGVIKNAIDPFLQRRSQERKVYTWFDWLPSISDKSTHARGFQARAAMGMVHVPEGHDGDEWIEHMIQFPTGKHDDEVDAAGKIGRALDEAHPATRSANAKPVSSTSDYGFNRRRSSGGGWKTS